MIVYECGSYLPTEHDYFTYLPEDGKPAQPNFLLLTKHNAEQLPAEEEPDYLIKVIDEKEIDEESACQAIASALGVDCDQIVIRQGGLDAMLRERRTSL